MTHNLLKSSLVLIFLLISSGLAAQNIISDRPGIGDGVSTLMRSQIQLETGFEMLCTNNTGSSCHRQFAVPLALLRFGVSDRVELRLIQSYVFRDFSYGSIYQSYKGFSNTSIGSKFKLTENADRGTQSAALIEVVIPTGSENVASDMFLVSLRYLHSWDFSESGNLNSNIGIYWAEEQAISLIYSFAVGYAVNDQWGIFIEPFGDFYQFEDFNISLDGGVTYLVNQKMQVDVSAGTGLNNDFYFIGLGFSWLIGK